MDNPYGCEDARRREGFYEMQAAFYEMVYSVEMQQLDECAKNISLSYYWTEVFPRLTKDAYRLAGNMLIGAFLIVIALY